MGRRVHRVRDGGRCAGHQWVHQEGAQGGTSLGMEALVPQAPSGAEWQQQERMAAMVAGLRSPSPPAGGVSSPLQTSGTGYAS